jgi:uncharacterized protein YndB with AHSA1/START domain
MDTKQRIGTRVSRQFGASPQHVFDAWLDSKTAGQWLFAARGQIICVEIDPRAGGWFHIVERRNGENVEYVGEYLEMIRPRRLVFILYADKYSLDFERVTVLFHPHRAGCELSLTHETTPELAPRLRRDWIEALNGLAAMLSEGVGDAAAGKLRPQRGSERIIAGRASFAMNSPPIDERRAVA